MGVKGLQSYLENHCPKACYRCSIPDLAKHFREKFQREPVIVVDGMSCIKYWYGDLEWLPGGEWVEYLNRVRSFVEAFKQHNIPLEFFFDGITTEEKRPSWINRRLYHMKECDKYFEILRTPHQIVEPKAFQLPASVGGLTRFLLKYELGCTVYTSIKDCDLEIAEYAKNNKCFAILGQDSDYMIFDTIHYVFSVNFLNLKNLTTLNYLRHVFARELELHVGQLPLLSCLVGNDYMPSDEVYEFQKYLVRDTMYRLRPRIEDIIPRAAKYILKHSNESKQLNPGAMKKIAHQMFGSDQKVHILEEGMAQYAIPGNSAVLPPENAPMLQLAFEKHKNCEIPPGVYGVMVGLPYDSSNVLEDCKGHAYIAPAAVLFRPIRQRAYSLLIKPDETVLEWCAYYGNPLRQPETVEPIPLEGVTVDLETLWTGSGPEVEDLKWSAMVAIVSPLLDKEGLRKLDSQYVMPTLLLHYIRAQGHIIKEWEINSFIAMCVSKTLHEQDQQVIREVCNPWLDPKAVHLASLFMKGVSVILLAMAVCGYPVPIEKCLPHRYFDGKLFHYYYQVSKSGAKLEKLCDNEASQLEQFREIKAIV